MASARVWISVYSDLLCIWAYLAHVKLDELRKSFGDRVTIEHRCVSVFGSTRRRVGDRWADRGGYKGYGRHVREVAARFGHVEMHPGIWTKNVPTGSGGPHLFFKAATLLEPEGTIDGRPVIEELAWRLRLAFFRDLVDISRLDAQLEVAGTLDLPGDRIRERIDDGTAATALAEDLDDAARNHVTGSPTFVLNEGRQKLYGNVGYRVIEANVHELLRDNSDVASWC